MHVCRIIPSTVGDIAPLDEGSYCADHALDSAFAQLALDVSVQSQDAAVKLQSAVLPVDVPVPQLSSLGVARLSKPLMLAGIEHVLNGLHDWLQHLAGVLMALKPMVTLAPLYLRRLYALVVVADVEQAPQKLDSGHREDLLRWRALLHDNAGKPLRARALKTVRIYGDASGIGGGAFMIDTATGHQQRIASQNWTADQRAASSTHREVLQMLGAIQAVLQHHRQLVEKGAIQYVTDNQAGAAAFLRMTGAPGMYEPIRQIYESAAAIDAEISVTWASRDTTEMQLADEFSRDEDASQMFVSHGTMVSACAALFDGAARWPTIDVFAGAGLGEHVVPQFFTEYPAAGSLGTDAFAYRWSDGISSALAEPRGGIGVGIPQFGL